MEHKPTLSLPQRRQTIDVKKEYPKQEFKKPFNKSYDKSKPAFPKKQLTPQQKYLRYWSDKASDVRVVMGEEVRTGQILMSDDFTITFALKRDDGQFEMRVVNKHSITSISPDTCFATPAEIKAYFLMINAHFAAKTEQKQGENVTKTRDNL